MLAASGIALQVISIAGAALVALIGGGVTIYQVRTVGQRATQRDDYTALWAEVRARDGDTERLRDAVAELFEQLKVEKERNIALDGELALARRQVLRLTDELTKYRAAEKGGEDDLGPNP